MYHYVPLYTQVGAKRIFSEIFIVNLKFTVGYSIMDCFCGPTTAAVEGCERRDLLKLMGGVSNNSVNIASGVGGPLSLWRWLASESSLRAQCAMEQYEDFQRPQQ
jgi:hypothetical protein